MNKALAVVAYDASWPSQFQSIQNSVLPLIAELIIGFEHVGSTSIEGLAAKPVIDIDAIYRNKSFLPEIIRRLETLGYIYEGNKGIPGREAFKAPPGIRHHLYVCEEGCLALRNHLAIRDYLKAHPAEREAYAQLKFELAPMYEKSPAEYGEAKTEFLTGILAKCGISKEELDSIADVNRAKN